MILYLTSAMWLQAYTLSMHIVLAAHENGERISLSWPFFSPAFAHEARFRLRHPAVAHKARFTGPAWVISAAFPDSAVAHEARSSALD